MKKLSTWLILLGILIATVPLIGRFYMSYQQDKMYSDYLKELEAQPSADVLDESFADRVPTEEAIQVEKIKPKKIENVIGRIAIPVISSDQLLLEGSSNKEMRFGAGHVIGSAMPGQTGNCAVAAHRNYTFGSYFSRLGEVKIGDEVKVTYQKHTYTYAITESLIVLPSDVWILKATDTPTITLITCHPKGSNTHRLILKGQLLVNGKPVTSETPAENSTPSAVTLTPPATRLPKPAESDTSAESTETPTPSAPVTPPVDHPEDAASDTAL